MTTTITNAVSTTNGAGSLAIIATSVLLILLLGKELVETTQEPWAMQLGKALNVAIVPLLIVFLVTVVMKIVAVLQ